MHMHASGEGIYTVHSNLTDSVLIFFLGFEIPLVFLVSMSIYYIIKMKCYMMV